MDENRDVLASVQFAADDPDEGRRLRVRIYTGEVMNGWAVVDLDGLDVPLPFAALMEHDPEKRVGVFTAVERNGAELVLFGKLLDTPCAKEFADLAKQGFPWQASMRVEPKKYEFVGSDAQSSANGKTYSGPVDVIRKGVMREGSVCSVGADKGTRAEVYSKGKEDRVSDAAVAAPVHATVEELLKDFPGEHEFVLAQLQAKATIDQAHRAFTVVLRDRLAAERETAVARAAAAPAEAGQVAVPFGADAPADSEEDRLWRKPEIRAEFMGDKAVFEAYMKAERKGLCFIQGVHSKADPRKGRLA